MKGGERNAINVGKRKQTVARCPQQVQFASWCPLRRKNNNQTEEMAANERTTASDKKK